MEAILKNKQHAMTIKELKIFIPFSINLDPFLKKVIRDEYVKRDLAWFKAEQATESQRTRTCREVAVKQKLRQKFKTENENVTAAELPSPIRLLPAETLEKWLSKKNVEEVCTLVRQMEGLKISCVDTYCDAIVSQNISGAVLARCNLQELKSVLNMNFGDWEIFQWTLDSLRQLETKQRESKSASKLWKSVVQASGMDNEDEDDALPKDDAKYIDNAIYMDEALISGLLSTLNEDAHEDVVTEELLDKHSKVRQRQQSETESLNEAAAADVSDVIYFTKSRVGDRAMSISIGSEDAFNALEKGTDHHLRHPQQPQKRGERDSGKRHRIDSFQIIGGGGLELHELHHRGPLEPQAWISQTAPASPMVGRSRASSVAQTPQHHYHLAQDQQDFKYFSEGLPASSVERLGDKMRSVKKGLKHALHKMEQPNTLPPVHRAPREKSIESASAAERRYVTPQSSSSSSSSASRKKSSRSQGASRQESIRGSIELPIFGIDATGLSADEDENNISSSPEQETVMPNKPESARPRVQNLFQ